jgi:hypothetical protein
VIGRILSSGSAFLQSITRRNLAAPPQWDSASHGLSSPTAHTRIEGRPHASVPSPLRSALRVWLPSRRFFPFEPGPALFRAGSAPGVRPSELSPLKRCPRRFRVDAPTYRFSFRFYLPPKRKGRPERPQFLGFYPFKSPWRPFACLGQRSLDAPLGLSLLGQSSTGLDQDFARSPLARLGTSRS